MIKREHYIKDDILYLKCKNCWKYKTVDNFYKTWKNKNNYRPLCKICHWKERTQWNNDHPDIHKKYHDNCKNKNLQKYKEKRKKRNKTKYDLKRKEIIENNNLYRKNKSIELWFSWIYFHKKAQKIAKENNLYPLKCPICWDNQSRIEIHHPFYRSFEDRSKIVFCCSTCHNLIHSWKIKNINIIELNKFY